MISRRLILQNAWFGDVMRNKIINVGHHKLEGYSVMRKNLLLAVSGLALSGILACSHVSRVGTDNSSELALVKNFSCYNCIIGEIGWAALNDPANSRILYACLKGATRQELATLGLADLSDHLRQLEEGTLLKRVDGFYKLGYPAISGSEREELRILMSQVASKLFPAARDMVQQIRPHLRGREKMLYHIVWSGLMDGYYAWDTLGKQLAKELGNAQVDLRTGWWIWPPHPYSSGTSTYGGLIITSLAGYPNPDHLRKEIEPVLDGLITSAVNNQPIPEHEGLLRLKNFGFIDDRGHSRLLVVKTESAIVPVAIQLSTAFARNAMLHLDIVNLTQMLETTPEKALVIAYHELCWELLKLLSSHGDLRIPDVKVSGGNDAYRLVSCYVNGLEYE